MGLFDNLFLDQNTPITINDGVDHSKDVTTMVVPPVDTKNPYPHGGVGGGDGTKDPKDDKKDNTVSDLFESDKKEEKAAEETLHPTITDDIALKIGKGPIESTAIPPVNPDISNDALLGDTVNFDIGGDISFDIGGDITEGIPSTDLSLQKETETSLVTGGENGVGVGISLPGEEIAGDITIGTSPSPALSEGSQTTTSESLPSTILNGEIPSPIVAITSVTSPEQSLDSSATSDVIPTSNPENSLLNLFSDGNSLENQNNTQSDVPSILGSTPVENTPLDLSASPSSSEIIQTPTIVNDISSGSILPELTNIVTLPSREVSPLRERLFSYVDELKTMQLHDQNQRNHKLEQISVLEERIREIDLETAARKKFIQMEIEALRKEVERMDQEKEEIKTVVSSFQKELEVG